MGKREEKRELKNKERVLSVLGEDEAENYFKDPKGFTNSMLEETLESLEKEYPNNKIMRNKIGIIRKLKEVALMPDKKEVETKKAELLELLEKKPTDYEDGDADFEETKYCEWQGEIKEALNDLLGFYEDDEGYVNDQIDELKKELKELNNKLVRHKHLPNGEAVQKL